MCLHLTHVQLGLSHLQPAKNAILAKTPRFFQCELKKPVTVEVCVISGKDKLKSESNLQYTYVPAGSCKCTYVNVCVHTVHALI